MGGADVIFERRSIRSYTAEPVGESSVLRMLEAAMAAPSARNEQPWHFIVISERKLLDRIAQVHPHAKMCAQAPLAILVCCDPSLEKGEGFSPVDCGNATTNLLLAAQAEGLGGVWVGIYPCKERLEEMKAIFDFPPGVFPFALVPLGHPAERKGRENRYKGERVHYNKW